MVYVRAFEDEAEYSQLFSQLKNETECNIIYDDQKQNIKVECGDSVTEQAVAKSIKAFNYGVPTPDCLSLLNPAQHLEIIDIERHTNNSRDTERTLGRIIGEGGRTRELMEELTGASVSVKRSKVVIVGDFTSVEQVRYAVSMLVNGAPHSAVYAHLEQAGSSTNMSTY